MGPFEQVLELACGTGIWTQALLSIGREITAVDAAPEMLEINAWKVANTRVRYQCADLVTWEPDRQYDLVFCAFWLPHVPPNALDAFLDIKTPHGPIVG
jgi:demethylmenaquinone methyltransferase/2-methoxy-6-polyprenyl-1,4-benzoquinol methylase